MKSSAANSKVSRRKPHGTPPPQPLEEKVHALVAELGRLGTRKRREEMGPRYGIHTEKAFGVAMADIQKLATCVGRDHALAAALWKTGWYEARMLASLIDVPEQVTAAQMDRWSRDFDNWGICDTVCFHLFDRTPHAFGKVAKWSGSGEEFVRRGAFALLASLALHDKTAASEAFVHCLPLIEDAALDDRNFVKKSVNWALRAIGERNAELNAAAIAVAGRLAASSNNSVRWVGKDALWQLRTPAALKRLAKYE